MRTIPILFLILVLIPTSIVQGETNQILLFGGNGEEGSHSTGATQDSKGDVFLYGVTDSTNLPVSPNAFDQSHNGAFDLFVAKYSHDLSTLLACTYFGGNGDEISGALVIGPDDHVYIAGVTASSNLPVTENAFDGSLGGAPDMFVARLSNDLSQLEALTYIGGRSRETAARAFLSIDDQGYLYLTGYTESSDFPTTENAYDTSYNGRGDSFLVKLDADLNVVASTYVGGSANDWAYVVANKDGLVYITGHTESADHPVTDGCYDDTYNSGVDVFVTCLSHDLSTLESSTYIGGSLFDNTSTMAIDEEGRVWIAGHTESRNYPTSSEAYSDTYGGGGRDVFISCLDPHLSTLISSTYIGGNQNDYQPFLAYGDGSVWVSGSTLSNDFPVTSDAAQTRYSGSVDYWLSELTSDLATLRYSTYLGGSGEDWFGIIWWTQDGLLVTGNTDSKDFMGMDAPVDDFDVFLFRFDKGAEWQIIDEETPVIEEEESIENGIPGFPFAALLLGVAILTYLRLSTRCVKPN
ncbi:MAG: hypothetical protein ABIJ47_04860 [Candidatus Bathyarchaeota archaeon]